MEPHELMNAVIGAKPVDFDKGFADMVQDRVAELVADKKLEIAKSFFGTPEATVEVDDETNDAEENLVQDSGDENDNTPDSEETE